MYTYEIEVLDNGTGVPDTYQVWECCALCDEAIGCFDERVDAEIFIDNCQKGVSNG